MVGRDLTYIACRLPVPELKKTVERPFDTSYTLFLILESILGIESPNSDVRPVLSLVEIQKSKIRNKK